MALFDLLQSLECVVAVGSWRRSIYARRADAWRQSIRRDLVIGEGERALNAVFQFANISGPIVAEEHLHRVRGNALLGYLSFVGDFVGNGEKPQMVERALCGEEFEIGERKAVDQKSRDDEQRGVRQKIVATEEGLLGRVQPHESHHRMR